MNKWISFACIVDSVGSRKDRSLKIVLSTPELPPNEGAVLLSLANTQGFCYISPLALQEQEMSIPDEMELVNGKTPSQRLRAVLWVKWDKEGRKGDFNAFKDREMERIIDQIKESIPD